MSTRTSFLTMAIAAGLAGGTALAPLPAQAQRDGAAMRDPLERPGQIDLDDRYPSQYPYGRPSGADRRATGGGGGPDEDRGAMARAGRDAFDRGYRAGRDEERRRQTASAGGRDEVERYWYVPDILPDTPRYRGMQDYALIPDRSRQMDRLMVAAQGLREAIQSLALLPANDRRNRAIERLHEALLETQQAMVLLPQEARLR